MNDDKRNQDSGEAGDEDEAGAPGAEGGSGSDSFDTPPGLPSDDGEALGDTDQHSDAPGTTGTGQWEGP